MSVSFILNSDGRCPELPSVAAGHYRLAFAVADYFREWGVDLPDRPCLDRVPVEFGVAGSGGHYHVPLLISPCGYSTDRGG